MTAKKLSGKSGKLSTSSAMSGILNRQKKSTKAIEKIMGENISTETSAKPKGRQKEKHLGDIAADVAARRQAQGAPAKTKATTKTKKTGTTVNKKAERPASTKKPASTKSSTSKKTEAKTRHNKRMSIEVTTLGAGLFKTTGAAVGGLLDAGKVLTGFASSGAGKTTESVKSGAKSARNKVKGVIKPVKPGAKTKLAKTGAGAVSAALATACKITGKVACGGATLGAGAGKAAGYVVTGALAAPVDIVNVVIGAGASATGSVSRLLFGPPESKGSKPGKRRKIPVV